MTKMGRKVEYCLMALKFLHESRTEGRWISAKEIAESCGIPFEVTARVLQVLAQNQILSVSHGALGGYQLAKPMEHLSLHDIITIIEGPMAVAKCLQPDSRTCEVEAHCTISEPMAVLNQRLEGFFRELKVSEVVGL